MKDNLVQYIEHLGFHILRQIDRQEELNIFVEDSISFVSNISKIRKFLNSNYGYNLTWSTNTICCEKVEMNFIVLTIKKEKKMYA